MHQVRRRLRFTQNTVRVYIDHMSLKTKILIVMALVCLILLAIISLIHINKRNNPLLTVCRDPKCQRAVSQIKAYVNTKADPCEDFYSFVCGRYHSRSFFVVSPLKQMQNNMGILMKEIVTSRMDQWHEDKMCKSARKQRQYYKLCIDLNKIDSDEDHYFISAFENITKELAMQSIRAENASWHEIIQRAFKRGTFYKFFLNVTTVYERLEDKYVLRIEPISMQYITKLKPLWSKENVVQLMAAIETHWAYPFYDLDQKIDALVKFSADLFNVSAPNVDKEKLGTWNLRMTAPLLNEETSMHFNANWSQFLRELTGVQLNTSDIILSSFQDKSQFDNLMKILSSANGQLWQTYIIINMIYEDCQYMSYHIRQVCQQILERAWPDDYPRKSRSDFCYDEALANFPSIADREYTVQVVPIEKRRKVENLAANLIKSVFIRMTNKHHVFDSYTRISSFMEYASQLKIFVGWHDVAYNEEEFEHLFGFGKTDLPNNIIEARHHLNKAKADREFDNMLNRKKFKQMTALGPLKISVDGYYDHVNHAIVLLAPLLNPPIYDEEMPEYLNYGSLGGVIGSLLINLLDEAYLALRVNSYSTTADWMSKLVETRTKSMQCVTEEYEKYDHNNPSSITPKPFKTILPKVFSHYEGMLIGYNTYNNLEVAEKEEELTDLLGYTRPQLFWIASSLYQCRDLKYESDKNIEETYRPSSFQYAAVTGYKVNGPAMNSYEFAKDFNCPQKSPMNPRQKCDL